MLIASKTNGDTLSATEFNQVTTELQTNLITKTNQTPSSGSLDQVGIAVASIAAQGGVFGTDSGAADAYVFTQISPFPAPKQLTVGLTIAFRPGNNNTGACTVNACGFGVKNIKLADGSTNPAAGTLSTANDVILRYNGTSFIFLGIILASDAQVAAATNTSSAITPAGLGSVFGASTLGSVLNLLVKVGGALQNIRFEMGTTASITSGGGTAAVSFTSSFTASPLVFLTWAGAPSPDNAISSPQYTSLSTSGFTAVNRDTDSAAAMNWLAIGY